ncbi:MAG: hypothetical protein U9Q03_06350 [Patescibacteria group bacterium]|nr:hypothetical protein [Patescibacteria group bacterium]
MTKCPDCQYRTNNAHRMEHHQKVTGHGGTIKRSKKWKGYSQPTKKKKGK